MEGRLLLWEEVVAGHVGHQGFSEIEAGLGEEQSELGDCFILLDNLFHNDTVFRRLFGQFFFIHQLFFLRGHSLIE